MKFDKIFDISGKTAIITGGGGTLGTTIAEGLASFGANVVIADIDLEKARKACERLSIYNVSTMAIQVDVTKPESVKNMVNKTLETFGKIDILVNHAGINIRKPATEYTPEEWDEIIDVNLKGIFLCAQAVGRVMLKQKQGKIINTASTLAVISQPHLSIYAASKGGIVQLTKVLAEEWAEYNINVNAIGPGYFETELTRKYLSDPDIRESLLNKIPMKRFGKPEDLVGAIIFLASDASNYVTGHTIYIDGGRLVF